MELPAGRVGVARRGMRRRAGGSGRSEQRRLPGRLEPEVLVGARRSRRARAACAGGARAGAGRARRRPRSCPAPRRRRPRASTGRPGRRRTSRRSRAGCSRSRRSRPSWSTSSSVERLVRGVVGRRRPSPRTSAQSRTRLQQPVGHARRAAAARGDRERARRRRSRTPRMSRRAVHDPREVGGLVVLEAVLDAEAVAQRRREQARRASSRRRA